MFDLNSWYDELGLTPEERAHVGELFSKPERLTKLEGSQLRQSDYSKHMNGLKEQETTLARKLADAEADIEAERGALTTWRTNAEGKLTAAQSRAEKLEEQLFKVQQTLRGAADEHGFDADALLKTVIAEPVKEPVKPTPTMADDEEFRRQIGSSMLGVTRLSARLHTLSAQHRKLFGEELPDAEGLVEQVLEASAKGKTVSIDDLWKQKYGVEAKRKELDDKAFEAKVEERTAIRVKEEIERRELGNVGPEDLPGSPILGRFGQHKTTNEGERPRHNGETAADAAKKAFQNGKYRKEARAIARGALAG